MAKQSGLFNFEGTLDNVTFYKTADGMLVRKKGGISRQRMLTDAAFIRTRENCAEFANCAKTASTLRKAAALLVYKAKDSKLSSRLIKLLFEIKKMDVVNVRGERNPGQGLTTVAGKTALKGFDFNRNAKWHSVLPIPYELDTATGGITISDFNPSEHLNFPNGATHFNLQSAFLDINFSSRLFDIFYSELVNYEISNSVINPLLLPSGVPVASGTKVYFLLVEFFQEVNGAQYGLNNGAFNALTITEVL